MKHIIDAIELSIQTKNYLGALFIALSAPDICGYLESPEEKSRIRYEKWFEKYMQDKYTRPCGPSSQRQVFLSPSDCYALRCALLHEGREEISNQHAREVLEKFHFIEPPGSKTIHLNWINDILQLQVDIFCHDVTNGLEKWIEDTKGDTDIQQRQSNLLKVYPWSQIPGISFTK